MKRTITIFLVALSCHAQTIMLTTTAQSARVGQPIPLSLTFTDATPSSAMAAIQWALSPAIPLTWTAGAASTAAAKTIACSPTTSNCIAYGVNQNLLASGVIATTSLTIPAGTPTGPYTLSLPANSPTVFGLLGATVTGSGIPLPAASLTINILSRFDINSDGVVDNSDVSLWIAQIITTGTCSPLFDFNGDGLCNVEDIVILAGAINGTVQK